MRSWRLLKLNLGSLYGAPLLLGALRFKPTLLSEKRVRVEDMASKLRKSRATAQRLLQDLASKGLTIRAESFIGRGGYLYEYRAP